MTRMFLAAAAALTALAAAPSLAQQRQSPFPPGDGRDIVAVGCTQCHAPSAIAEMRMDADAWRHQVYDMILRGAQITPNEVDKAVDYLATNFGPGVNVPPPVREVTLPDGPGKDLVSKDCVLCHGLDRITAVHRSDAMWAEVVKRMEYFGAPVSSNDEHAVVSYLDTKFGEQAPTK